jgi:hypothetical protein
MRTMTARSIPPELDEALRRERARRGQSLDQTVIDRLGQRLGIGSPRSNGLARLAGRWTEEELERFTDAIAPFERVDDELWR